MSIEKIRALFDAAVGTWWGANWTHELRRDGEVVCDVEDPVWCEGGTDGCETCAEAEKDAADAVELASMALRLIALGRTATSESPADAARRAANIEKKWGDDPTWGPFAAAVEEWEACETPVDIVGAETCDECGSEIPDRAGGGLANRFHTPSCSLFDAKAS